MAKPLRVLTQVPFPKLSEMLASDPDVELVTVPTDGEPPPDVRGEVLLTFSWGSPNLAAVVERGVHWIHTIGTGVDRFPLDAVGDRMLTCARGATAVPIAEWVLAMLLAFEKQLPEAWADAPPERWNLRRLGTLEGRTLGLVGLGTIARETAQRALAFGMRVRAYRRTRRPSPLPEVELAADLLDLVRSADHLVVACAATPATRHLIGAGALAAVRPGVHLVNVSRGSLVDPEALRTALNDGRVARASLDTVEPEPLPAGHWLYAHPRVRLSPHISWNAPGALESIFATFVANLRRQRAGEPLADVVDPAVGY